MQLLLPLSSVPEYGCFEGKVTLTQTTEMGSKPADTVPPPVTRFFLGHSGQRKKLWVFHSLILLLQEGRPGTRANRSAQSVLSRFDRFGRSASFSIERDV